jgi:hypothetical protein
MNLRRQLSDWARLQMEAQKAQVTRLCARTTYFDTKVAGHAWHRDGSAAAVYCIQPTSKAPRLMYLEIELPRPAFNTAPQIIRKKVWRWPGFAAVFRGEQSKGWCVGARYKYVAKLYADADYKTLLGVHVDRAHCITPVQQSYWMKRLKKR